METQYRVPRFKQRFTFVLADTSRIYHTLDLLKVADAVIFLTSVNGLSENGDIVMTCVMSQGLPNTVLAVTDLQTAPLKVCTFIMILLVFYAVGNDNNILLTIKIHFICIHMI